MSRILDALAWLLFTPAFWACLTVTLCAVWVWLNAIVEASQDVLQYGASEEDRWIGDVIALAAIGIEHLAKKMSGPDADTSDRSSANRPDQKEVA
jgi:hypothetical protein